MRKWVLDYTGITIPHERVCQCHQSPGEYFAELFPVPPPVALILGPRGGGKSFLSALHTHLMSRTYAKHGTRILGGSRAQSEQIYWALREAVYYGSGDKGSDAETIAKLMKSEAIYHNGSNVSILAASSTSVRGPHVPSLKLDEVDEIDSDLREAAMGMCMNRHGSPASVLMTSTWHRLNGPMSQLMERANEGEFPLYKFCTFDVLENCSAERSGRWVGGETGYENCPQCPSKKWCHSERDLNGDQPLAKRSRGHYAIEALIQKVKSVSRRTFESDYLCIGPRSDGIWFPTFDPTTHVDERAEFDPHLPVHVSVDSGVVTGAVFFQVAMVQTVTGPTEEIHVFADYLADGMTAEQDARAVLEIARTKCQGRHDVISTDPAGGSRNAVGVTVFAEFERAGLRPLQRWPFGLVTDGLALVESFINPAIGPPRLIVHPRCEPTIRAIQSYRRTKRGGQWMNSPADPQHPHEDIVDALRGGLRVCFPEGRVSKSNLARVPARQVF